MIVLDTDVLWALMCTRPDPAVIAWLNRQPGQSTWITTISVFEARFGIALLSATRRRQEIETAFTRVVREDLEGRILDFDLASADKAAVLAAERQRTGRPVDFRDTQIAGIVLARGATLATRNTRHFQGLSVPIANPWNE